MAVPALAATMAASLAEAAPKPAAADADLGSRVYNIRTFGAKGDGKTVDTRALQAAIDACTRDGGGLVLVPAGTFVIGSTELKSNVTLRIAAGGTLLGSADGTQYHAVDAIPLTGDSTLADGNWALLYAVHAKNVTVEGPGVIDGQGHQFYAPVRGGPTPAGIGGNKRPYHILIHQCENVTVRDIDLLDCAYHSVRVIQSKRIHLDGIYIHGRVINNNDGFHFISAQYVTLSNCVVLSQDDACALFGSCKFVTVTNCVFSTRWSVFRFGGGFAENISVSNCVLYEVFGCPIKLQGSPGSRYENLSFSNLVLKDVTGPIHIGVGPRRPREDTPAAAATPPKPAAPGFEPGNGMSTADQTPAVLRNISFSHIHGNVILTERDLPEATVVSKPNDGERNSCIVFNCVGGAIMENVSVSDVHLRFAGGGTAEDAARRDLPQFAGEYFMLGVLPAYGVYARGVKGLTLSNVRLQVEAPDLRPAVIFDNVNDAAINGLSIEGNPQAESALRFIGSRDVLVTAARLISPAATALQVEGAATANIVLDGGDLSRAAKTVAAVSGASASAVKVRA
ncbi:MAG TPA: glycosyl hydrolase family 28 protein [Asticcacaulis sp.]|nr:glycosyl hydrolase family 28 protein [Asticcacaulis sp.]